MSLRYLPNLITGLRFLLILPVVVALLGENYRLAFYFFLIAGLSDGIDGLLARYYGWTSHLGAILDPVADKLLLIGSFIAFTWLSKIPWWLTAVVVGRDLWIMLGALAYRFWIGPIDYHPLIISKLNTVLQLGLILLLLVHLGFWPLPVWLLHGVTIIMSITTLLSFMQYGWVWGQRAWHHTRQRKPAAG